MANLRRHSTAELRPTEGGSIDEPIAEADDCFDLASRRAELRAEAADMHVDRSRFDQALVAPDALEQPIARHDAILVLDEIPQQLEFPSREAHRRALDLDRDRVEIGDQPRPPIAAATTLAAVGA